MPYLFCHTYSALICCMTYCASRGNSYRSASILKPNSTRLYHHQICHIDVPSSIDREGFGTKLLQNPSGRIWLQDETKFLNIHLWLGCTTQAPRSPAPVPTPSTTPTFFHPKFFSPEFFHPNFFPPNFSNQVTFTYIYFAKSFSKQMHAQLATNPCVCN